MSTEPAAPLKLDETCYRCDYNLRGLLPEGLCPECGASIRNSLDAPFLRFAPRKWLRRIRFGLLLLAVGIPGTTTAEWGRFDVQWLPDMPGFAVLATLFVTAGTFLVTSCPAKASFSDFRCPLAARTLAVLLLVPTIIGLLPWTEARWGSARMLLALGSSALAWTLWAYLRDLCQTAVPPGRAWFTTAAAAAYSLYAVMVTFAMLAYLSGNPGDGSLAFAAHVLSYPIALLSSLLALLALIGVFCTLWREEQAGNADGRSSHPPAGEGAP